MSQLNIFAALEELASNPKNLGFLPAPEDFADTQEFTQAEVDEYFFDFPFCQLPDAVFRVAFL